MSFRIFPEGSLARRLTRNKLKRDNIRKLIFTRKMLKGYESPEQTLRRHGAGVGLESLII